MNAHTKIHPTYLYTYSYRHGGQETFCFKLVKMNVITSHGFMNVHTKIGTIIIV